MQGARTTQQFKQDGMYSRIHNAPQMENPKAVYWDRGIGNTDPLHGPAEARTQQQVRQQGMYSQIYNVAGKNSRLGDSLYGPAEARTQQQVRREGLYSNLFNATKKKTLGGYLGDAASATMPGLLVAVGLVIVYFVFFKNDKKKVHVESHDEEVAEPEEGFSFYY